MIEVKDLMTTDLHTLRDSDCISKARDMMAKQHIRHIPILNQDDQFVGILTQRDVLASTVSALAEIDASEQSEIEQAIPIANVMISDVSAVDEHTGLREVAEYLLDHKYGCLPVLSDGYLVGIITETDFMKLVIHLLERLEEE